MSKYIALLVAFLTPILFINCSPSFNALDMSSIDGSNDVMSVKLDESLMTASQTYLSMSELTGVQPNTATMNEYERLAKTALSESQRVASITAPIMMTTANLASRFCEQVVTNEKAQASTDRRFFSAIDFSKGLALLSDDSLDMVANQISFKMWGRAAGEAELAAFRQFKLAYYEVIDANQKNNVVQTERFALSLCTAGLSTYEAMSL